MSRTPRDKIVAVYEHDLVGQVVLGNFGRGVIEAVRWCALWCDKQVGIHYDDSEDLPLHEAGAGTELMWEDLDEVELTGEYED